MPRLPGRSADAKEGVPSSATPLCGLASSAIVSQMKPTVGRVKRQSKSSGCGTTNGLAETARAVSNGTFHEQEFCTMLHSFPFFTS